MRCGQAVATPAVAQNQGSSQATDSTIKPLAGASLVLGFLAFVGSIVLAQAGLFMAPFALAAIAAAARALSLIERSPGGHPSKGKARAGLAFGCIGLAFSLVWIAVALGNRPSRIARNESSAVGQMRTVNTATITYRETYPKQGFPASLKDLGPPAKEGAFSPRAAGLIDEKLASGTKNGYRYVYAAKDTHGDGALDAYTIRASPVTPGETGFRYFFSDESGIIRFETKGPADEKSEPVQ